MRPILLKETEVLPIEPLNKETEYKSGEIYKEVLLSEKLKKARQAAEVHRRCRYKLESMIKPGMSLSEICKIIEESTCTMLKGELNDGISIPTGVPLNECAAHYTPDPGDEEIFLKEDDVLKIDFGTHVDGMIADSAFTICFDPKFENLLLAAKESMEEGIKFAGVDVRVCDIGERINEVMTSYEVELNGETKKIIPIRDLDGHSIERFSIHGGTSIPLVKNDDTTKLTEDSFYAIETFATTGEGKAIKSDEVYFYALEEEPNQFISNVKTKRVLECIKRKIGRLPFCARHIDRILCEPNFAKEHLKILTEETFLEGFAPISDVKGSYVAQFEHTFYLSDNGGKEILTRGNNY